MESKILKHCYPKENKPSSMFIYLYTNLPNYTWKLSHITTNFINHAICLWPLTWNVTSRCSDSWRSVSWKRWSWTAKCLRRKFPWCISTDKWLTCKMLCRKARYYWSNYNHWHLTLIICTTEELNQTSWRSGAQSAEFNQQHVKHSYTKMWESCMVWVRECFDC